MHSTAYLIISVIPVINLYHLCLADSVLMCYYPSTARLRTTMAKFEIKDINFTLCTHYIYQYAVIDNVTHKLVASDPRTEEGPNGLYRQFTNAKIQFPSIKTLLAVGGDNLYTSHECKAVGENTTFLNVFATSAVSCLRLYGFDGLDLFCPPVFDIDKSAPPNILKALRETFDGIFSNDRLILAASGHGLDGFVRNGYDAAAIVRTVDYVIIETHKLYYDSMRFAHFPTALYPLVSRSPYLLMGLNVSLSAWYSVGVPYNKMVVGFTGVGRIFKLVNQSIYQSWAPITLTPFRGVDYNIDNGLAYPEICEFSKQARKYYDDVQKSPFMVKDSSWVGYDDPESLKLKIEWVMKYGVAGIMFASLDVDDFTGRRCSNGTFPLLVAMNKAIMRILPDNTPMKTTIKSSMTSGGATDSIVSVTGFTERPDKNINMSNLLIGFMIVLVLIAYVALFILCLRTQTHQYQAE